MQQRKVDYRCQGFSGPFIEQFARFHPVPATQQVTGKQIQCLFAEIQHCLPAKSFGPAGGGQEASSAGDLRSIAIHADGGIPAAGGTGQGPAEKLGRPSRSHALL